jgi:hypothetical protein
MGQVCAIVYQNCTTIFSCYMPGVYDINFTDSSVIFR